MRLNCLLLEMYLEFLKHVAQCYLSNDQNLCCHDSDRFYMICRWNEETNEIADFNDVFLSFSIEL